MGEKRSILLGMTCLCGLAGCANPPPPPRTLPPDPPATNAPAEPAAAELYIPSPLPPPQAQPSRPTGKPKRNPAVASFDLAQIVGLPEEKVASLFGQPTDTADEPPGKTWHYRDGPCTLTIKFFPEVTTRVFHVLDYKVITNDSTSDTERTCRTRLSADAAKTHLEP